MQRAPEGPQGKLSQEVSLEHLTTMLKQVSAGGKRPKAPAKPLHLLVFLQGGEVSPAQGQQKAQPESLPRLCRQHRNLPGSSREDYIWAAERKKHRKPTQQPHFSLAPQKYKGFNHHLRTTKSEPFARDKRPSRKCLKVGMSSGPFLHHPHKDPTSQVCLKQIPAFSATAEETHGTSHSTAQMGLCEPHKTPYR